MTDAWLDCRLLLVDVDGVFSVYIRSKLYLMLLFVSYFSDKSA